MDGAISNQIEIVQRLRELAVQASNGILSAENRAHLETEFDQLVAEYQRIQEVTDFNGEKLLAEDQEISVVTDPYGLDPITVSTESTDLTDVFRREVGSGEFELQSETATAVNVELEAADMNGDGHVDQILHQTNDDRILLSFGDGEGNFSSTQTIATHAAVSDMAIADADGDGDIDILVGGNPVTGSVLWANDGTGNFTQARTFAAAGVQANIFFADVNGDDIQDIVGTFTVLITQTRFEVYLGQGGGAYAAPITNNVALRTLENRSVRVADLDGDGDDEIAGSTGNVTPSTSIFSFSWTGSAMAAHSTYTSNHESFEIADVDNNGTMDYVVGTDSEDIDIAYNTGAGTAWTTENLGLNLTEDLFQIELGDFNDDGLVDILGGASEPGGYYALEQTGSGDFTSTHFASTADIPKMRLVDIDEDGFLDFLYAGSAESGWYKGLTNGVHRQSELSIETAEKAQNALSIMDYALQELNERRSAIGAYQSRFDSVMNNSQTMIENLAASESSIGDLDYGEETAEFTRLQILQQANVAVLGQSNLNMQVVLNLLGTIR